LETDLKREEESFKKKRKTKYNVHDPPPTESSEYSGNKTTNRESFVSRPANLGSQLKQTIKQTNKQINK